VKSSKTAVALLSACLSVVIMASGCSKGSVDHANMGPAPTQPPGGNPYAPGTAGAQQLSLRAQQDFVDQLGALPRNKRPAFIRDHGTTMTAIQSGPDSPQKQKLMEILNQR
jgi:hypothetical protein